MCSSAAVPSRQSTEPGVEYARVYVAVSLSRFNRLQGGVTASRLLCMPEGYCNCCCCCELATLVLDALQQVATS
jgi:hypothetical protein